jgi:hypothetical protein
MMHIHGKTLGTLAAVSSLAVATAAAEVEYEIHTGYSNEYLLHGIALGQDLIEAGADVTAKVSGIGLSAGAWYGSFDNADIKRINSGSDIGELDLFGQVSKDFEFITGSVGYIYRYFESNETDTFGTQDLLFSLSRNVLGINLSLTYYWSVEKARELPLYNDGYSEFAIGKSFEFNPSLTLNCGGKLGYLVEAGQLTALTTKVSLDWSFTPTATLSPFISSAFALNDDFDNASYASKNRLVGGMMLSVDF